MPNLETLTPNLYAGWDGDNPTTGALVLVTNHEPGDTDLVREIAIHREDLPALIGFLERHHLAVPAPPRAAAEVAPGVVAAPSDPTLAERTTKALEAMHDHPGAFQTEAVVRLLHQRTTALEATTSARALALGGRVGEIEEHVRTLDGRVGVLAGSLEGDDGLTASVAELALAVDTVQTLVGNLQNPAAAPRPKTEDEDVTRSWGKDEVGAALRRHAGAMHEAIARSARQVLAVVAEATKPRPGLVSRLLAAVAPPAAPTRPPVVAPDVTLSPEGLQEVARGAVAATGVAGS